MNDTHVSIKNHITRVYRSECRENRHCLKASGSRISNDYTERMPKELIDYWAVEGTEDLYHSDVKSFDGKPAIQK